MYRQRTLKRAVSFSGVGLHSGERIDARIRPAPAGAGIVFIRTDLPTREVIPAVRESIGDTTLATTLGVGEARIATVEHLMAALMALGVDNARIEVNGAEVPVMDGSASPFVHLIRQAGLREQAEPRHFLLVKQAVSVEEGDRRIEIRPAREAVINCAIDFPSRAIGRQSLRWRVSEYDFARLIAPARTFGFYEQVEALQAIGLGLGGSPENAVVISGDHVLNPEGLRFPDEAVRHKVLDILGDLALIGMPFIGEVNSHKGGHHLNQQLVAKLLDTPRAWEVVERTPELYREVREPFGIPAHNVAVRRAYR